MSEEKIVYITIKGKKYHFNSSCSYLRGKIYNPISLEKAKNVLVGPCSACLRSMEQNEEIKNRNNEKQ